MGSKMYDIAVSSFCDHSDGAALKNERLIWSHEQAGHNSNNFWTQIVMIDNEKTAGV